jgi:RNA polymerase sigma-70 factor (ECF subfamily)
MLTVLETLGPTERAVFVLRDVFETPYDEIAEAVGRTQAAVRQIAHRARAHVAERRPRTRVSRAEQQAVVERFMAAVRGGDLQPLLDVLDPAVILTPDGGGVVQGARRPIHGADAAAKLIASIGRRVGQFALVPLWLNGAPAIRLDVEGDRHAVVTVAIEHGRITRIYAISNPEKLRGLGVATALSR